MVKNSTIAKQQAVVVNQIEETVAIMDHSTSHLADGNTEAAQVVATLAVASATLALTYTRLPFQDEDSRTVE